MGANGRTGPVASDSTEILCIHCPVASDSSGDVGLVCGMKRGISRSNILRVGFIFDANLGCVQLTSNSKGAKLYRRLNGASVSRSIAYSGEQGTRTLRCHQRLTC